MDRNITEMNVDSSYMFCSMTDSIKSNIVNTARFYIKAVSWSLICLKFSIQYFLILGSDALRVKESIFQS